MAQRKRCFAAVAEFLEKTESESESEWDGGSSSTEPEELNDAIIAPLQKGFEVEKGNVLKVEQVGLPILRAKFRVLWRESALKEGLASLLPSSAVVPPDASSSSASSSKSSKELPSGWWQAKIAQYESAFVAGAPRKFPQEMLLGADRAGPLLKAAAEPNPLNAARKKSRQGITVLAINEENQLEAEPEAPWRPKSVLAFIDCLESIRHAYLLLIGNEQDIATYIDWWARQVRS